MTFWMFRHKPSGLFFKNARSQYLGHTFNLVEKGKAFFHKPHGFDWIKGGWFRYKRYGTEIEVGRFVESDWEIVEFNTEEQSTKEEK